MVLLPGAMTLLPAPSHNKSQKVPVESTWWKQKNTIPEKIGQLSDNNEVKVCIYFGVTLQVSTPRGKVAFLQETS